MSLINSSFDFAATGHTMLERAATIRWFPRSLTGRGVRQTLNFIAAELDGPRSKVFLRSVPSGFKAFDWVVPPEWSIDSAYIKGPDGSVIADYQSNPLCVVGYSCPVQASMDLDRLRKHIYTLPEMPDVTPYVTSYYEKGWGFALPDRLLQSLEVGEYEVSVNSQLFEGSLDYAEVLIEGQTDKEVLFSTYICHPSMLNNEISGIVLAVELAKTLAAAPQKPKFTYRFLFAPETIGSLVFLSQNLEHLQQHVIAGYVLTCVGDEREYSYLPSRDGNTLSDRVAINVIDELGLACKKYSWLERGSDERQFCAPGIDLPICSVMRSKYGTYPEYHTSADDFRVVTANGLAGSFEVYIKIINALEMNVTPIYTVLGEPQLGPRGLYANVSKLGSANASRNLLNLLSLADGKSDLITISRVLGLSLKEAYSLFHLLSEHHLLEEKSTSHED